MKTELQIFSYLETADWLVFALVLLVTLACVVYGNLRRHRLPETGEEAMDRKSLFAL